MKEDPSGRGGRPSRWVDSNVDTRGEEGGRGNPYDLIPDGASRSLRSRRECGRKTPWRPVDPEDRGDESLPVSLNIVPFNPPF